MKLLCKKKYGWNDLGGWLLMKKGRARMCDNNPFFILIVLSPWAT